MTGSSKIKDFQILCPHSLLVLVLRPPRLGGPVGVIFEDRNLSAEHKFPSHHTHKIPVFNQVLYTSSTGTAKHILDW